MASRRVRLIMTATTVAALLAGPTAWGQPSAADRETARSMMQEGRDLRDKGDPKGALQRFKAADDIMHVPTTSLEVARAQVSLGLLIEALDTIAMMRKTPPQPDDPAPFKDARVKADELGTQIEAKVPSLVITVTGAKDGDSPAISVDGVSLPAAAAMLPRKVNPGQHVVAAHSASGDAREEVEVADGEKKEVSLVLVSGEAAENNTQEPGADQGQTASHGPGPIFWGGVVVGGVGLAAGAIAGILTLSKAGSLSNECTTPHKTCTSANNGSSDLSAANSFATISDVGFIVAAAGAGVAIVSLILGHKPAAAAAPASAPPADQDGPATSDPSTAPETPAATESKLQVTPWIGFGSAGVTGTF
jgi:hypothetical protein